MELDLFCFLAEMGTVTSLIGYVAICLAVVYLVRKFSREKAEAEWKKVIQDPSVARSKDEGYHEQLDEIITRLKYIHWALCGGFGFIILCALGVIKIGFVGEWWAY